MAYVDPRAASRVASRRCLHCGWTVRRHHRWTRTAIARSSRATFRSPVVVFRAAPSVTVRAPVSPSLLGQWAGHAPLVAGAGR